MQKKQQAMQQAIQQAIQQATVKWSIDVFSSGSKYNRFVFLELRTNQLQLLTRLPPIIIHRCADCLPGPSHRVFIHVFTSDKQAAKTTQKRQ